MILNSKDSNQFFGIINVIINAIFATKEYSASNRRLRRLIIRFINFSVIRMLRQEINEHANPSVNAIWTNTCECVYGLICNLNCVKNRLLVHGASLRRACSAYARNIFLGTRPRSSAAIKKIIVAASNRTLDMLFVLEKRIKLRIPLIESFCIHYNKGCRSILCKINGSLSLMAFCRYCAEITLKFRNWLHDWHGNSFRRFIHMSICDFITHFSLIGCESFSLSACVRRQAIAGGNNHAI